jgi:flagellar basal body-associated protein FliL
MNKKKAIVIIIIIIAAIVIPIGIYTISPLFVNTVVNEPAPTTTTTSVADLEKFEQFMSMNNEEQRAEKGQQMTAEVLAK